MSTNISVISHIAVTIDGIPYRFGSTFKPISRVITGDDAYIKQISIGTSSIVKFLDVANDIADFDFVLLASDFSTFIEFVVDETNAAGVEAAFTLPLFGSGTAGTWGIPLTLGRNNAYGSDHTQATFGGNADTIDTIRIQNASATQEAKAICMAFS